jgi:hypothetical protein
VPLSAARRADSDPRTHPDEMMRIGYQATIIALQRFRDGRGTPSLEAEMLIASSGWWFGSILLLIIWIAVAFWPARVAARKGHSFFGYLPVQPGVLPSSSDRGLHGWRSTSCDGVNAFANSKHR